MQISREEARRIIRLVPAEGGKNQKSGEDVPRQLLGHSGSELLQMLLDLPEVRAEKVLRLRTAILERRYKVPAEQVAEKILCRVLADRVG